MSVPRQRVSGIYVIQQVGTDRFYIGSSRDVVVRWKEHRVKLTAGNHHSPFLQACWKKHGPLAFTFDLLEECSLDELIAKEQEYLDAFAPSFNVCDKAGRPPGWDKWSEASKQRFRLKRKELAALITHCPAGHQYDEANTHLNKRNKRICRPCAAVRMSATYATETAEQTEARRQRMKAYYDGTREERQAKMREYAAGRKEEKRAYDQSRAELKAERDRARRVQETPEQRAHRLELKTSDYQKHHAQRLAAMHANYRKNHPEPQPATACKNGHAYADDSFRMWRGKKLCKVCRAQTKRAYRERVKVSAV